MWFKDEERINVPPAVDLLIGSNPWSMNVKERIAMTVSCHDTDYLPKVTNAGRIIKRSGQALQVMHNGMVVTADGYYSELIQPIIKKLKGHHEPQEEKVFANIVKRVKSQSSTMIELGSFWAYYSLWFKHDFRDAAVICCEPDPNNIEVGRANMKLNGFKEGKKLIFLQSAAGSSDGRMIDFECDSERGRRVQVPVRSVDSLCEEYSVTSLDILHIDVQGAELDALHGAIKVIKSGKLRFVFVSTHHYVFSGDPMTHEKCRQFIEDNGGHVIASHNIIESFSGDGLIVASFKNDDKGLTVPISVNTGKSLMRPYEKDLSIMMEAYDDLSSRGGAN